MGRSLKLEILAEEIETLAQLRILQDEGCDEVQGDLLIPDRIAGLPGSGPQIVRFGISLVTRPRGRVTSANLCDRVA